MSKPKSKAKPKQDEDEDEPETIDTLLKKLSEHGLNFVLGEPLWDRLAAHGLDIIPTLLERTHGDEYFNLVDVALETILKRMDPDLRGRAAIHLEESLARSYHSKRRVEAVKAFCHIFAKDPRRQDQVLNIALDITEDTDVRVAAFQTLSRMNPIGAQAERLLAILDLAHEQWIEHERMCDAAFICLREHALQLPGKRLLMSLDPLLTHSHRRLRNQAIDLVGAFGDVDLIEHLFALPDARTHQGEIFDAVKKIGLRPVNLLSLRPDAFEAFVARLLRRMEFQNVKVGCYSRDGGVDASCSLTRTGFVDSEREDWIVQCKRYSTGSIDEATVQQFAETLMAKGAHRGLFVTTSDYTSGARAFAASRKSLELISGPQLLQRLEKLFGDKRYTIRVRR